MPTYCLTVAFSVAINSWAPHVGGSEFEFPAWIMFFLFTALPTEISQLFCDAASVDGFHVPEAMGWLSDFQSVSCQDLLFGLGRFWLTLRFIPQLNSQQIFHLSHSNLSSSNRVGELILPPV